MKIRFFCRLLFLFLILFLVKNSYIWAQSTDIITDFPYSVDGSINTVKVVNNLMYFGGNFSYIGDNTGRLGIAEMSTADVIDYPRVDGTSVDAAVSDGNGGFFIGGTFTAVGGETRTNLAHILADGSVDPNWNPAASGAIYDLKLSPDEMTLYVVGAYTTISGVARNRVAALEVGSSLSCDYSLLMGESFEGGTFPPSNWTTSETYPWGIGTSFYDGAQSAQSYNAGSGQTSTMETSVTVTKTSIVTFYWKIAARSTAYLYFCLDNSACTYTSGYNDRISGAVDWVQKKYIVYPGTHTLTWKYQNTSATITQPNRGWVDAVEVNEYEGPCVPEPMTLVKAWNPGANNIVYSVEVNNDGSVIYLGGSFSSLGVGTTIVRTRVGAVDSSGSVVSFDPVVGSSSSTKVYDMALSPDGSKLYVGGYYIATIGGLPRIGLGAVYTSDGSVVDWVADTDRIASNVYSILPVGDDVWVGGSFESIGGVSKYYAAKVDASTAQVSAWDEINYYDFSQPVYKIVDAGDKILMGRNVDLRYNREIGPRLVAFDKETGELLDGSMPFVDGAVKSIAVDLNNDKVLAGGVFSSFGGVSRSSLAALDMDTRQITNWDANLNFPATVNDIEIDGSKMYVGGGFTSAGGLSRNNIAAISTCDGSVYDWHPNLDNIVYALELNEDKTRLFVGGYFLYVDDEPVNRLVSFSTNTGEIVRSWKPAVNNRVSDIEVRGSNVYISGKFNAVEGVEKKMVAGLNAETGALTDFSPEFEYYCDYTYGGSDIDLDSSGQRIFMVGDFSCGSVYRNIVGYNISDSSKLNLPVDLTSQDGVSVLVSGDDSILYVGKYGRIYSIDLNTYLETGWTYNLSSISHFINDMYEKSSSLFAVGSFSSVGGLSTNKFVQFGEYADIDSPMDCSALPEEMTPTPVVEVTATPTPIYPDLNSILYPEAKTDYTPLSDEPNLRSVSVGSGRIYKIIRHNNATYVAGDFVSSAGRMTGPAAIVNKTTSDLVDGHFPLIEIRDDSSYNLSVNKVISDNNGGWFVAGYFDRADGGVVGNLIHVLADGSVDPDFLPIIDDVVENMVLSSDGNTLYVGGWFLNVNGQTRNRLCSFDLTTNTLNDWNPSPNNKVYTLDLSPDGNTLYVGGIFTSLFSNLGTGSTIARNRAAAFESTTSSSCSTNDVVSESFEDVTFPPVNWSTGATNPWGIGTSSFIGSQSAESAYLTVNGISTLETTVTVTKTSIVTFYWKVSSSATYGYLYFCLDNSACVYNSGYAGRISGAVDWVQKEYLLHPGTHTLTWKYQRTGSISGANRGWVDMVEVKEYDSACDPEPWTMLKSWNPNVNNSVNVIKTNQAGNLIYMGGAMTTIGGVSNPYLRAIDVGGSVVSGFSPTFSSTVSGLEIFDTGMFVFGSFSTVNGESRVGLAKLDLSGVVDDWHPDISTVYGIKLDGNILYVAGYFDYVNGKEKKGLVALDKNTAEIVESFDMEVVDDYGASTIAVDEDEIYIGTYSPIIGTKVDKLFRIGADGELDKDFSFTIDDEVLAMAVHKNILYIGGYFNTIDNQVRNYAAAIDLGTGELTNWNPNFDGQVNSMAIAGDNLYVGGYFEKVNGYGRTGIVAFENGSDVPSDWRMTLGTRDWYGNPYSYVNVILPHGNKIFIGGDFSSVNDLPIENLAMIDAYSAEVENWAPNPNDEVLSLVADDKRIYIGGSFTSIGVNSINYFAAFDLVNNLELIDFGFGLDDDVVDMAVSQNSLFVSGWFYEPRYGLFEMALNEAACEAGQNTYYQESFEGETFPPSGDWTSGGSYPWVFDATNASDGVKSIVSTNDGVDNSSSTITYTVNLAQEATLSFDWRISSETGLDFLCYCVNEPRCNCDGGFYEKRTSGEIDWTKVKKSLASGENVITWMYKKNGSYDGGDDFGWIDNVIIDDSDSTCTVINKDEMTSWNPGLDGGSLAIAVADNVLYTGGDTYTHYGHESIPYLAQYGELPATLETTDIEFGYVNRLVGENSSSYNIPVTLKNGPSLSNVSVSYTVTGGTADSSDYLLESGTATILAGSFSTSIPVTLYDNEDEDGDKTVFLNMSSPVGGNLGMYNATTLTIVDDEGGSPIPTSTPTLTPTPTGAGSTSPSGDPSPTTVVLPTATAILTPTSTIASSLDVSIDSPGDNHYTNQTRPIFSWKINSDDGTSVNGYEIEIDNGKEGDFMVGGIPSFSSTSSNNSKYWVEYLGFKDGAIDNNVIRLATKSSSDWSNNENDGTLHEGRRQFTLKVDAKDEADVTLDRDYLVDLTKPILSTNSVNSYLSGNNLTFSGSVRDNLNGDNKDTRVASGPREVNITIKKLNRYWFDNLISTIKINLTSDLYWCTSLEKISDNKLARDDKCTDFEYKLDELLQNGVYLIEMIASDQASNQSDLVSFNLSVGEETAIVSEEKAKAKDKDKDVTSNKKEDKKQENENALQKLIVDIVEFLKKISSNLVDLTSRPIVLLMGKIQDGLDSLSFIPFNIREYLVKATENWYNAWFEDSRTKISDVKAVEIGDDFVVISWKTNHPATSKVNYGSSYDYGSDVQSDILVKNHIVKIEGLEPETDYFYEVMSHGRTYTYDARHEFTTLTSIVEVNVGIGSSDKGKDGKKPTPTEVPTVVGGGVIDAVDKWLSKNDTKISGLKVSEISHNSAVVSWKTNHPATTVIKYSASTDLAYEVTSETLTTEHRVVFEYLEPKTTYYFKAISFGRTLAESDMKDFNTRTIEWAMAKNLVSQTPTLTSTPTATNTPVLSSPTTITIPTLSSIPSPTMTSTPTATVTPTLTSTPSPTLTLIHTVTATPIPTLTLWPEVDQLVVETATPTVTLIVSPTPTEIDRLETSGGIEDIVQSPTPGLDSIPENDTSETPQTPLVRIVEVDKKDDVVSRTVDSVNRVRYDIQESPTLGRSTEVLAVATDVAVVVGLGQVLLVTMTSMFNALNYLLKSLPMTLFTSLRILFGNLPLLLIAPIIPLVRNKKKNIEGVIVGENGKPLRNALVVATFEGRVYISRTLIDGKFNLKVDSGRCILVFIKKGFVTQKRVINITGSDKNKMIRVTMISRSKQSVGLIDNLVVGSYEMARGTKIGVLSILMTILVWVYFIYPSVSSLMMILATMVYLAKSYLYREE